MLLRTIIQTLRPMGAAHRVPSRYHGTVVADLFRIRTDLPRAVQDGFVFPLGVMPAPGMVPSVGWSVEWHELDGEGCCTFHIVTSFDRLQAVLHDAFSLMPEREVFAILELGSRDAYREVDVYLSSTGMPRAEFLRVWDVFEPILLEDATLGVGINSETPFMELFIDPDKGLLIHVDSSERSRVEAMLESHNLREFDQVGYDFEPEELERIGVRPILEDSPDLICDIDQLLMELKQDWHLELDDDPTVNLDGRGRRIGRTLWHAVVILEARHEGAVREAHAILWGSAESRDEMELLMRERLRKERPWEVREFYVLDRAAFDDRPADIDWLPLRPEASAVHMIQIDPFEPPTWMHSNG